jgi:hypothetical protein
VRAFWNAGIRRQHGVDSSVTWTGIGDITICPKGWPKFPALPKLPGLYRITLRDGQTYIGQAGDLRRRLYEYRRPTKGNEGEHILHAAIIAAGGGRLEIATDGRMADSRVRIQLEQAEIQSGLSTDTVLLNEDGPATPARLKAKIAFHEREIARLREKLNAIHSG